MLIDDSASPVSLTDQWASPNENERPSLGNIYAVLQAGFETGLMIVGLLFVALLLSRQTGFDGGKRYQDLLYVLASHNLFQPHSKYSLIGPFFSIPLLVLGRKLGHPEEWICFYNLTLFS